MKKKSYLPPTITVVKVQLEGQICNGSVDFNDTEHKVTISDQSIDKENELDFSDTSDNWDTPIKI